MSPRKFDRFMVDVELSGNPKVGRLSDAEFRCLVGGVWPLAAKASVRGFLIVGRHAANESDVAHQARCTVAVARRTLGKLRDLGMLEHDPESGWEYVHDWGEFNPDPRPSDSPEQTRDRKARSRARHANVTRDNDQSHAPEVEVKKKNTPPGPPPSGGRQRDREKWEKEAVDWATALGFIAPKSTVIRAVKQAEPWTRNGDAAEFFVEFLHRHYAKRAA